MNDITKVQSWWEVGYFCKISRREYVTRVPVAMDAQDAVNKARTLGDGNKMEVRSVRHIDSTPYFSWN